MTRAIAISVGALVLLAPASAPAAKVTETAPGIVVSDASPGSPFVFGEGVQTFRLKGEKVEKKQIRDVNLTLNVTSPAGNPRLDTFQIRLVGPRGDEAVVQNHGGNNWVDLELDDQSILFGCNPMARVSSRCNYELNGNGTLTGTVHGALNPVFKGLNPRGTWQLLWRDGGWSTPGHPPTTIGTSTLEVKTGKRFAKEEK